jgi:hypothetical protein
VKRYPYRLRGRAITAANAVWSTEIVCTQMTKTDMFTARLCRKDVANLHVVIGDHDPVDEQLDELPTLFERRVSEPCLDALTEIVEVAHRSGQLLVALGLVHQLLLLVGECLVLLVKVSSSALIFGERDDAMPVDVGKPLALLLHAASALV